MTDASPDLRRQLQMVIDQLEALPIRYATIAKINAQTYRAAASALADHDEVIATLRAGWQPIETAAVATMVPVVLWGPLWRQPFVGVVLSEAMGMNCWLDGKDGNGMHMRATHWMPLPAPPGQPDAAREDQP